MNNGGANLTGKTVLLGVTGCIAAYKSCEILRGLQKAGVRVKVVMTEHATHFVGPTTFRALTHEPVAIGLFDDPSDPIHHISLAEEADAFLIAPCTANVVAKIANGICDDLLSTTAQACTAPLIIAPAMNVHMYEACATQSNFKTLKERGAHFIDADSGYLACGDVGRGRLADPDVIVAETLKILSGAQDLSGQRVMITAGPTVEAIDPVRYLTNRSSGKMGYALARAASERGAEVTLISGPTALECPCGVSRICVESAQEMLNAAQASFADCDIAIFAAAVADMRPEEQSPIKLKKGREGVDLSTVHLVENPDIIATLASTKNDQIVVGFAAETNDVVENARIKLAKKNADLIVANLVGAGKAFGTDDNKAYLVSGEEIQETEMISKAELADVIIDKALEIRAGRV